MTVLVEHGSGPYSAPQMHPFFQPVRQSRQTSLLPSAPSPSSLNQPDVQEDVDGENSSSSASQAGQSSPSTSVTQPHLHHSDDLESDPNQQRRKRRKVTPSSRGGGLPLHDDSTDLDHERGENGKEIITARGSIDFATQDEQVKPSPELRRRSEQLTLPTSTDQTPPPFTRQLTINLSPSKTRQLLEESPVKQIISPKKNTLRLSSGGKLVTSPSPNQALRGKNALKGSLAPSKNLKLRNGLIVSSLKVVLPYARHSKDSKFSVGVKINQILHGERRIPQLSQRTSLIEQPVMADRKSKKETHPFFLGKAAVLPRHEQDVKTSAGISTCHTSDSETVIESSRPKAWSDIKFSSSKFVKSKDFATTAPPWPSLASQHHRHPIREIPHLPYLRAGSKRAKDKHDLIRVPGGEDILSQFSRMLSSVGTVSRPLRVPEQRSMDPGVLVAMLQDTHEAGAQSSDSPSALQSIQRRLYHFRSAFDRGQAAGPQDWIHDYAPKRVEDVLQPQGQVLLEWLKMMKVHEVQSRLGATTKERPRKVARRRGRPKRQDDDMDDFIVSSDDEETTNTTSMKNTIIICGPPGCGKTASVYAAASELDFEVFEIHPGMKRGAKELFDRVGDMTRNHLVQQPVSLSHDSSAATDDSMKVSVEDEIATGKQNTMAGYMKGSKKRKGKHAPILTATLQDTPSLQKQSLILLEEVDILFEEDRSFWPGVQALIQQSKRPIVLTCNSLESVPVADLPLHATLLYEPPTVDSVVDYLSHIALAEGHLLDREAISSLYQSRGHDLRASLMDLDFWCQMTVGSKIGGLDWIHPTHQGDREIIEPMARIISCGTFYPGLNLVPEASSAPEELLSYYQDQLDISVLEWESERRYLSTRETRNSPLAELEDALIIGDSRSCMDVLDHTIAPTISTALSKAIPVSFSALGIDSMLQLTAKRSGVGRNYTLEDVRSALEPLTEDLRTFPPPIGRTSPNIDGAGRSVATEIAPYVRSIVTYDQRLEQRRSELGGPLGSSQSGKQRRTRAARAALEGGDKSNTRREKWFPKELDIEAVLSTGMGWPQSWFDGEMLSQESQP